MKTYKVMRFTLSAMEILTNNHTQLENAMNEMAKNGWEVVSQSSIQAKGAWFILVTFCKEVK
jgi:hypothetical protein